MGGLGLEKAVELVELQVQHGSVRLAEWMAIVEGQSLEIGPRGDEAHHLVEVALDLAPSQEYLAKLGEVHVPVIARPVERLRVLRGDRKRLRAS